MVQLIVTYVKTYNHTTLKYSGMKIGGESELAIRDHLKYVHNFLKQIKICYVNCQQQ